MNNTSGQDIETTHWYMQATMSLICKIILSLLLWEGNKDLYSLIKGCILVEQKPSQAENWSLRTLQSGKTNRGLIEVQKRTDNA